MKRVSLLILLCACWQVVSAQIDQYKYKVEIIGVEDQWHQIPLSFELLSHLNKTQSDIRIYGIDMQQDTIEVPYYLKVLGADTKDQAYSFQIINRSQKDGAYYFTLKASEKQLINEIHLDFGNSNFDWNIDLEGSTDLKEWFNVADQQRVLSFKRDNEAYRYTTLNLPDSQYRYYRIHFKSSNEPKLKAASSAYKQIQPKQLEDLKATTLISFSEDEKLKQTHIDIRLNAEYPVEFIQINVKDTLSYHRKIEILQIMDSVRTQKKWSRPKEYLTFDVLRSDKENLFYLHPNVKTKHFQIVVYNEDNAPLKFGHLDAFKFKIKPRVLVARFPKTEASYYLVYGNETIEAARYDILQFKDEVPASIRPLKLASKVEFMQPEEDKSQFDVQQWWLWLLLIGIGGLLSYFAFKMMRSMGS